MKKILLVEDESPQRKAIMERLGEGYEILEAPNGAEGVQIALKEHPDLIVFDIHLPVLGGIEAMAMLREDEWGKTANILVLSMLDDQEVIENAKKHNYTSYLVKSESSMADIAAEIKRLVD